MKPRLLLHPCFALAAIFSPPASQAATFCVSTAAELHAALAQAETNGQDDEIRLVEAVYASATGFSYSSAEPHELSLRGDWSASCAVRTELGEFSSLTIPGNSGATTRILDINAGAGAVLVEALRIYDGSPTELTRGGGLRVRTADGDITIDRNYFIFNTAASNGALYARSDVGDIRARNNVVASNSQLSGAAIALEALDGNVYASGNTVHGNLSTVEDSGSAGLGVTVNALDPNRRAYLSNNVLRNNNDWDNLDLEVFGANHRYYNAVVEHMIGGDEPAAIVGEISQDPRLCLPEIETCGRLYTPLNDSPLLDAGANIPFGGGLSLDVFGQPRVVGGVVDIGAIENLTAVFSNGFE
jgi:hypothetical protein